MRHEPSLLAPLACVLVFEAGVAVLRLPRARPRRARGAALARLLRAGARRRVRRALAAGHIVAAADGARRDRALLRRAGLARLRGRRRDLRRADADPSDVQRLPARAPAGRRRSGTGARGSPRRCPWGSSCCGCGRSSTRPCRTTRARASRRAASPTTASSSSSRATATSGSRRRCSAAAARWRSRR